MTAIQFYFPYFFENKSFNNELKRFGLSSFITYNKKTEMPDNLLLVKKGRFGLFNSKEELLKIPFGATLMFQDNYLLYWLMGHDDIELTQVQLDRKDILETKTTKLDLSKLSLGKSNLDLDLNIRNFVTYVRREDLAYDLDYYERFVIIQINKQTLNMIPFDWFNKTGGDYGYVWPALARLDSNSKLHGRGMRMTDFIVELDGACL